MQDPKQEKTGVSKPTLLSSSGNGDSDDVRILTSLSGGKLQGKPAVRPMQKKARRRAGLLALLLVLVAGGIAGTVLLGKSDGAPAVPLLASAAPRPAPTPPAAAATSPGSNTAPGTIPAETKADPASADSGAAVPASTAAIITDETPPEKTASATDGKRPDKLTSALEDGVKPPPAALQTALEASSRPVKEKPAVSAKLVHRAEQAKEASAKAGAREKKANKPALAAKGKQADDDVDLISALVAHSSGAPHKSAAGAGAKSTKLAQADKSAAAKAERNQDIVERRPGESTASLLQRCHSLGFIEGELCRWRICSGRWDTDASCHANSSN